MRAWLVMLVALMLVHAPACADSRTGLIDQLQRVNDTFSHAVEAREHGDATADRLFRDAAAGYESLIEDYAIRNDRLHVNAANAFALGRDPAHAVLHYRRALALNPRNTNALEGLERVRRTIPVQTSPGARPPWIELALAARARVGASAVLMLALAAHAGLWTLLAMRTILGVRVPIWALTSALVGALIGGAWIGLDQFGDDPSAVVMSDNVVARAGPSDEVYEPAVTLPLSAGTEVRLVQTRERWARIELAGTAQAWVPRDALQLVHSAAQGTDR